MFKRYFGFILLAGLAVSCSGGNVPGVSLNLDIAKDLTDSAIGRETDQGGDLRLKDTIKDTKDTRPLEIGQGDTDVGQGDTDVGQGDTDVGHDVKCCDPMVKPEIDSECQRVECSVCAWKVTNLKDGTQCSTSDGKAGHCSHGTCLVCDHNGVCDSDYGEDCENCTADCGECCGNGKCEASHQEDCSSCPADCGCTVNQSCENGKCVKNVYCGDGTCDSAKHEDCLSCPQDCGCKEGQTCQTGKCVSCKDYCQDQGKTCGKSGGCDCGPQKCPAGKKDCNGSKVVVCSADGCEWNEYKQCPCGCKNGECVSPECNSGQQKCENSRQFVCDGCKWQPDAQCKYGCDNNECKKPQCTPDGTKKCENNIEYTCENGMWKQQKTCNCGCDGNQCKADCCTPHASYECRDNDVYWKDSCGKWQELKEKCSNGCKDKECISPVESFFYSEVASVTGYTCAGCNGPKAYKCPKGYKLTSCQASGKGSHGCCAGCDVSQVTCEALSESDFGLKDVWDNDLQEQITGYVCTTCDGPKKYECPEGYTRTSCHKSYVPQLHGCSRKASEVTCKRNSREADFHLTEVTSITVFACAACGDQYTYKCPPGYVRASCEDRSFPWGSHGCCDTCIVARVTCQKRP